MRHDARAENWISMDIKGVRGYFNDMRIDRASVPEWLHFWELADGDCDGIPCRYKPGILVNFFGTFLTAGELPVDRKETMEGYISSDEDWGFTGEQYIPFGEVIRNERERMARTEEKDMAAAMEK